MNTAELVKVVAKAEEKLKQLKPNMASILEYKKKVLLSRVKCYCHVLCVMCRWLFLSRSMSCVMFSLWVTSHSLFEPTTTHHNCQITPYHNSIPPHHATPCHTPPQPHYTITHHTLPQPYHTTTPPQPHHTTTIPHHTTPHHRTRFT